MKITQFARLGRTVVVAAFALAVIAPAASAGTPEPVADGVAEVEKPVVEKPEVEKPVADKNPSGGTPCADRVLSRVFTPWHDRAPYTLAPGGDFETQAEGWTLEGPATIAADGSPFLLGEALGVGSLELAAGATAVSPPICVQRGFKSLRLVARSVGAPEGVVEAGEAMVDTGGNVAAETEKGVLKVQVVYADGKTKKAGRLNPGFEWAPTRKLSLAQGRFRVRRRGSALIQLRFAAIAGTVRIDDVYVDPRYHR